MNAQDVLQIVNASPFIPFRIHLTDGSNFEIRHPEMIKVDRHRATVFYHKDDMPKKIVLRSEFIGLPHINRIEPLIGQDVTPPAPGGNGHQAG
jgi:hypothetical protein